MITRNASISEDHKKKAMSFGRWYHEIKLSDDFVTDSNMLGSRAQWDMVATLRTRINYKDKSVLDLGTMDGMWAFGAEEMGAASVVAADFYQSYTDSVVYDRFMLAKEVLHSNAIMVPNVDIHDLDNTLRVAKRIAKSGGGFDIVQCLGLLYHVQNPMLALHQVRGVTAAGGIMLLETAMWGNNSDPPAARFNSDSGIYNDATTFWAPNYMCLVGMLLKSRFTVEELSQPVKQGRGIYRQCFICRAIDGQPTIDDFGA